MTDVLELSVYETEYLQPVNLPLYNAIDTIWMVSHAVRSPTIPMWIGYNCLISNNSNKNNNNPRQVISYLTPINSSPTNTAVVSETMKQSKQICEEFKQSAIQVTYDLTIAKVAMQIQATEATFNNLFIHLVPFHIMMAYFKAIGKVVIDCGLSNIMVHSNLLAWAY